MDPKGHNQASKSASFELGPALGGLSPGQLWKGRQNRNRSSTWAEGLQWARLRLATIRRGWEPSRCSMPTLHAESALPERTDLSKIRVPSTRLALTILGRAHLRSEERRVGKEC